MAIAIIIDWYGPFKSFEEFSTHVKENWVHNYKCIYMAFGAYSKLRYVGLTKRPTGRFQNHPKMKDPENRSFFIGAITSQGVGGRRKKKTKTDLDLAELALICALQPSENDRRKSEQISDCVSIYSRFFNKSGEEDWGKPHPKPKKFPVFIGYNSYRDEFDF